MGATHLLCYTPILLLAYQTIKYAAAIGTGQQSLLIMIQHRFSLLMVPTPLVVNHWIEYLSQCSIASTV